MEEAQQQLPTRKSPPVLTWSIIVGATLLFVNIFRWTLVEWLTPFLMPLLELGVLVGFAVVIAWSIVHVFKGRKRVGVRRAIAPLGVNIAILLVVLFVPFTELTTKLDFRWHYAKRTQVVAAVLNGSMERFVTQKGGRGEFIHLPPQFSALSAGGDDIMVFRRDGHVLIFFFTYRGILDNFSGFIYSTNGVQPEDGDFGGRFVEIEHLRPNWYWAAST